MNKTNLTKIHKKLINEMLRGACRFRTFSCVYIGHCVYVCVGVRTEALDPVLFAAAVDCVQMHRHFLLTKYMRKMPG